MIGCIRDYTIKSNTDIFASVVTDIYNQALKQRKFPSSFNGAVVLSVYKSSDETHVSLCYQISLNNSIAKVFEVCQRGTFEIFPKQKYFLINQYVFYIIMGQTWPLKITYVRLFHQFIKDDVR